MLFWFLQNFSDLGYNRYMKTLSFYLTVLYVIGMTSYVVWAEAKIKNLKTYLSLFGYKENAKDGDGDGMVQEGTIWERKI